jgi:hypothetical protein
MVLVSVHQDFDRGQVLMVIQVERSRTRLWCGETVETSSALIITRRRPSSPARTMRKPGAPARKPSTVPKRPVAVSTTNPSDR